MTAMLQSWLGFAQAADTTMWVSYRSTRVSVAVCWSQSRAPIAYLTVVAKSASVTEVARTHAQSFAIRGHALGVQQWALLGVVIAATRSAAPRDVAHQNTGHAVTSAGGCWNVAFTRARSSVMQGLARHAL